MKLAPVVALFLCATPAWAQKAGGDSPRPPAPPSAGETVVLNGPQIPSNLDDDAALVKDLASAMDDLNHMHFLDQLPPIGIVIVNRMTASGLGAMGYTHCIDGDIKQCTIYLSKEQNASERTMIFTLFHETCHVVTIGDGHGSKWQSCMVRLATKGAFENVW